MQLIIMGKVLKTISVDREIWAEAKVQAYKQGKSLSQFVEEALREKLQPTA